MNMSDIKPTSFHMDDVKPLENRPGFFEVVNPLYVFKKVFGRGGYQCGNTRIANLIIPVGAIVYLGQVGKISHNSWTKLRADQAFVHSIVDAYRPNLDSQWRQYQVGHSWWNSSFTYRVGELIKPNYFSMEQETCVAGIHFFVNVEAAKSFR